MKKGFLGLILMLIGLSTTLEVTAQRVRTTAVFDADTSTRPKAGFYGVGVRSGIPYLVKPTGNTQRFGMVAGFANNYLPKFNASGAMVSSGILDNSTSLSLRINTNGDVGKGSGASYGNFFVNETRTTGDRHAFEDWAILALTDSNLGYCSFDAKPTITNTNNYQHYVGYQSRLIYSGSGNVTDYVHGYDTDITHNGSGTISSLVGIRIRDVKGSGPITTNYGIYINDIVRGATNYAIYSNGGQSYHKGSFGIGAIPTSKLHVSTSGVLGSINSSFDDILIENTDYAGITIRSNDNSLSGIRFNSPSSSIFGYGLITADYTNSKMQIGTNLTGGKLEFLTDGFNISAMNITSSGNVGIGTASPTQKLTVTGSILADNNIIANNSFSLSTSNGSINLRNNTYATSTIELHIRPNQGNKGYLTFTENAVDDRWAIGIEPSNSSLHFKTTPTSDAKLLITSSGNVGINTTTPTSKLQVVGLPTYADNAGATSGGLTAGAFYRTSTGVLMVVY